MNNFFLLALMIAVSSCNFKKNESSNEVQAAPSEETIVENKTNKNAFPVQNYLDNKYVGIWKLYSSKYSDGSGSLVQTNHYLNLNANGTFEENITDRHSGNWFSSKGMVDSLESDLLLMMDVNIDYQFNRSENKQERVTIKYGKNSLWAYSASIIENNGTTQLIIFDLGSYYNGGNRYTFIKQ